MILLYIISHSIYAHLVDIYRFDNIAGEKTVGGFLSF